MVTFAKKHWKYGVLLLMLIFTVILLTGCGDTHNDNDNDEEEQSYQKVSLESMGDEEYQNLNKFFDAFAFFNRLEDIKTDEDVLSFGIWRYQDGMGEFSIPEEKVEQVLNRYFGVEKINHEAVGDHDMGIPSYKNGFYNSGGGVGWITDNWYNVSELTDNEDGTLTVEVSLYEYFSYDSGIELPFNRYDRIKDWNLLEGQSIVDGGDSFYDINIHRLTTDTVTIRPYKYEGEDTWQIININGWDIPKTLY